jgi:hypothetical protein
VKAVALKKLVGLRKLITELKVSSDGFCRGNFTEYTRSHIIANEMVAVENQLLHGQQPNLTGVYRGCLIVLLGQDIYIKVQELSMWKFRNNEI